MADRGGPKSSESTTDVHEGHLVLVVDGHSVSTVEVATSFRDRSRGLLGRDGLEGALLLDPAMSVHTLGMRFTIDVAYCDRRKRVVAVRQMRPGRLGRIRIRCRSVLEAEAGSFERWGLVPGSILTTRPLGEGPADELAAR